MADQDIKWLSGRIEDAQRTLSDIERGMRRLINGHDITGRIERRARETVTRLSALVAAYSRLDRS